MSDNYLILKIAAGVVLGLLIWNAVERYQERQAIEAGFAELQRISADPDPLGLRAAARRGIGNQRRVSGKKPVPPGFQCTGGVLLKKAGNGWSQITSRNNEWFCPPGGTVGDCYQVTESSVGCR